MVFPVAANGTEILPSAALVKAGMLGKQVHGDEPLRAQIIDRGIEQSPGDPAAAMRLLRIDRADVGSKILSLMKVVLYYPESPDDASFMDAEIPAVFRFARQIGAHTFDIGLLGHLPL
jgi:hypothetical protein